MKLASSSPTCEDDDCGKKDTPAPVAPATVEDATEPPVPAPKTTDPPVKVEIKEPVPMSYMEMEKKILEVQIQKI